MPYICMLYYSLRSIGGGTCAQPINLYNACGRTLNLALDVMSSPSGVGFWIHVHMYTYS